MDKSETVVEHANIRDTEKASKLPKAPKQGTAVGIIRHMLYE